jgi:hypothetical protein
MTTHRVYWTEDGKSQFKDFTGDQLMEALKQCEDLRKRERNGEDVKFIVISSEVDECTSLKGVDVTDSTYDWKKRRRDENDR